jgi:hypothetical protein
LTRAGAVAGFFASGAPFRVEGESKTSRTGSRFDFFGFDVQIKESQSLGVCDADVPDDARASPTKVCDFVRVSGSDDAGPFAMSRGRFDGVHQEIVSRASVLI